MAIAFGSGANDTADVNGSGGNIVLGAPTGIAADDYRLHVLTQIGGSGAPDIGTGMTNLGSITSPLGMRLSGKVAGGSEGSITHNTPGTESVSAGRSIRLTGVDPASPVEDSDVGVTASQSGSVTLPTLTTTVDGCRLVYVILPDDGAAALSMGQTLHDTDWNFGSGERLYIYYEDQASAGTSTARTVTFSGTHSVAYWMVALAPEGAAATVPDAPTDVRTAGAFGWDSEVDLSWSAPASDGGASITGYRIRRSTDDGDTWTTHTADTGTTSTSATLTGLSDGTRYLFEVAAINSEGTGAATVSEWGCTPLSDSGPVTPPSATTQTTGWPLVRLDQTGLPLGTAYNYRYTGAGVYVYVVDTGVRDTHTQFSGITVASGYSVAATDETNDVIGHGTSVAALVAGSTYGSAKGVTIVPIKVFEDDHNTAIPYPTQANLISALEWIENNHPGGPAVVNCSFALGTTGSGQIDAAVAQIETMVDDGFMFVLSAGNEGGASTSYEQPALVPGVLVVGGTEDDDSVWSGSSLGPEVDIFAPAHDILSARGSGDSATDTSSGTSYSAPLTSGVIALWRQANPDLTPRQLVDMALAGSTKDVVTGSLLGSWNRFIYSDVDIPEYVQTVELPAIASGSQQFAPTVEPGSVTVELPHISSAATLYQPTITPPSSTVALPLIGSSAALYAPQVAAGAVTVSLPILSESELFTPTVVAGVTVGLPLISSAASLFAPTVSPDAVTVVLPLISGTQLFAVSVAAGAATVVLPSLSETSVLAPTVTAGAATVVLPLLSETTVFAVSLASGLATLTLPILSETVVSSPGLTGGTIVGVTNTVPADRDQIMLSGLDRAERRLAFFEKRRVS